MTAEDPKEYLQKQIFVAGRRSRISAIQYYDVDDGTYCPFCGKKQKATMGKDGHFSIECSEKCSGYKEELRLLEIKENIEVELREVETRLAAINNKINDHTMTEGTKTAALHYMSLKDERDEFNKKIEELTK